ncbi:MAG TPA: LCP family protein [Candidatus Limnocylindrales bacterium]
MAALLSFLWPGLGQLYTGKRRLAAVFAVPALLVVLVLVYQVWQQGLLVFGTRVVVQRAVGLAVVAIVVIMGAWRLVSVALAFTSVERRPSRRILDRLVLGALVAIIVVSHLAVGGVALAASNLGDSTINSKPAGPIASDFIKPTPLPGQSVVEATPNTPELTQRVTMLFTGYDAAPSRDHVLYDSLMVVSYDPKTNSVQMVSVPRDSTSFPLYFGKHQVVSHTVAINSLAKAAASYGSPDSGYMTLVNEVSYLVGIKIDYFAAMDLLTFVKLIDLVGGIDVDNPAAIDDWEYDWLDGSPYGFHLAAGLQHLTGRNALAYVRSRKSAGDNDFGRSSRQQEVLMDLMHKMAKPDQVLKIPEILSTLGSGLATGCVPDVAGCTFPADRLPDYVSIGQNVPKDNIKQVVLSVSSNYSEYEAGGQVCLFNDKLAQLSRQLFGSESLWTGKKDPVDSCPAK